MLLQCISTTTNTATNGRRTDQAREVGFGQIMQRLLSEKPCDGGKFISLCKGGSIFKLAVF